MAEEVTLAQYKVLMAEFSDAIDVVAAQSKIVQEMLDGIDQDFRTVSDLWLSPAALTFDPLRTAYKTSADDLNETLASILQRMRITYNDYLEVEAQAVRNLTADSSGGDGSTDNSAGGSSDGSSSDSSSDGSSTGDDADGGDANQDDRVVGDRVAATSTPTLPVSPVGAMDRVKTELDPLLPLTPRTGA
ncbi:hypothetical protein HH310_22940 [Actinoplanes sp. TBRC 11911]|uniref:hypothetical protein n=1 Tax=Actinoplanes sp. TBRC 11911 TaxID=2729386 RepID=UPI00145CBB62|nr:hypothetical protein [Actinoplanes sp. TBRC 11911]NMO54026.1 hypothetical protein [Actinoplanes sp. TBRC 11911]